MLTRELLTVTEPHLLGVGLGIEEHILETIVKNNKFGEFCLYKEHRKKCAQLLVIQALCHYDDHKNNPIAEKCVMWPLLYEYADTFDK